MWKAGIVVLLVVYLHPAEGLSDDLKAEIRAHKGDVDRIINYVTRGEGKHMAWNRLAKMTDTFGPRGTGSQALEDTIDYCLQNLEDEGFANVHPESFIADHWVRGAEFGRINEPIEHEMNIMSLGSSVGGDVTALVEVVHDFDELHTKYNENNEVFKDKIVLYNMEWEGYSKTVRYRRDGASWAGLYGAKAAMIRSVTDFSIDSPHTGQQNYFKNVTEQNKMIPIAAIAVEDAQLIDRIRGREIDVNVTLHLECDTLDPITTRNVVAEMTGAKYPDEYVIIGGHIDSWDVGMGVMDDGGGVMVSWMTLTVLKALGLKPKRTIRTVFWSAEEIGLVGAYAYHKEHKAENASISLLMESDYGTFKPLGIGFTGVPEARAVMTEVLQLLEPIGATGVGDDGSEPDTGMWLDDTDVPLGGLWNANDKYFFFHHTDGDSMTMEDPDDLDLCVALWASVSYVVANLENKLSRVPGPKDLTQAAVTFSGSPLLLAVCLLFSLLVTKTWKK